ncbi:hypothetical protein C8F01DRAFT_1255069 [Mycena amicta]|nr:hypothetical protein C8F01DRAFT_1255069 [Mycena amicta]
MTTPHTRPRPERLGERYVDFAFAFESSALKKDSVHLIVSYDIVCQYGKSQGAPSKGFGTGDHDQVTKAVGPKKTRAATSTFVYNDIGPNPSVDVSIYFAPDSTTVTSISNVAPQKRVRLDDDLGADTNADFLEPLPLDAAELEAVAGTLTDDANDVYEHFIQEDEVSNGKRHRYESSDDPMKGWRRQRHIFLDHLLRHDGLGEDTYHPACSFCNATYTPGGQTRLFRCQECGVFLQCESCLEEKHRHNPLHVVKEWNGEFWDPVALHRVHLKDESCKSLRFGYQLGHRGGPCPLPRPSQALVVIDTNGVFTLDVKLCGCSKSLRYDHIAQLMGNGWYPATVSELGTCATFRALELFRMLNVVGNLSAHDFVGTLERLTDPTLLGKTPDRYRAFSRMARQYAFLKRGKRSALGYEQEGWNPDAEGVGGGTVKPGTMAVECWACPRPGFNLPTGWESCGPDDEFLYALMLALDANFRLKNRMRANERQDPSLGSGWSYFVDDEPYKEHLRDYVAEEDVSNCIAFAALMQKDTKLTTGLRVSGVGGLCLRATWSCSGGRAGGPPEGYANMDYILMHAIGDARVKRLLFSYDIACQWKQHLRERVLNILDDSNIPTSLDQFDIQFGLPVWHAAAHEETCQATNSLSYAVGVGRTDGEGIERTWAVLNPIGFATKEMGQGNRHDTIEDKVDHINFEKNVGQGETLARKLIIAVAERDKQVAEFVEIDSTVNAAVRQGWMQQGEKMATGPSEAQVAAELKQAEVQEARDGRGDFMEVRTTAAAFVKALLQLEDLKRRIKNEVRGTTTVTANRSGQIDELRASFFKKLKVVQRQQDFFMPGVSSLRLAEEECRDADRPPPKAEDVKLWLPSDLTETQRGRACRRGLLSIEGQLREAQCGDALGRLRSLLFTKTHLIHHRNANSVGQRAATRSSTLIGRVTDRITREATKYRQARTAMQRLMGNEYRADLEELADGDLNVRGEEESDAGARLRLGRVGATRRARNEPTTAGNSGVSWIWRRVRDDDEEVVMHDAVRVRWAKTLARRDRWLEEVRLLREEMKRVLRSLRSVQQEWGKRVEGGRQVEPELAGGLQAYARRQVAVHAWMAERFFAEWNKPGKAVVEEVMRKDLEVYRALLAGEEEGLTMEGSVAELEETSAG